MKAARNHRDTYGPYAISINKSYAGTLDINPVWYIHDKSSIAKHIQQSIVTCPRFSVANNVGNVMFRTLAYIKPTIGSQPSRSVNGSTTISAFEEEMEWRFTPKKLYGTWLVGTYNGFVQEANHLSSQGHQLVISPEQIENVFVQTNEEVKKINSECPSLVGKISTW